MIRSIIPEKLISQINKKKGWNLEIDVYAMHAIVRCIPILNFIRFKFSILNVIELSNDVKKPFLYLKWFDQN